MSRNDQGKLDPTHYAPSTWSTFAERAGPRPLAFRENKRSLLLSSDWSRGPRGDEPLAFDCICNRGEAL